MALLCEHENNITHSGESMHGLEMMMRVGPEFFEAFFVYKFKIKRLENLKHHNENL